MTNKRTLWRLSAILVFAFGAAAQAHAQFKNSGAFYAEAKKGVSSEASIGDDLFGESINLQDGSTSFRHVDVSLTSNGKLPIVIGRKFSGKKYSGPYGVDPASEVFGNSWVLDVPYMMGTFDTRDGWISMVPNSGSIGGRCSAGTFTPRGQNGPWPYYHTTSIGPENFWNGTSINVPGYGEEQLLVKTAQHVMPTDGRTYYGVTRSNWRVACLPSIKNGSGEGFLVLMPDGAKYYFDWMMSRKVADLTSGQSGAGPGDPQHLLIPRSDVFLYATRAEDRFGNWVEYQYDPVNPQRLLGVSSNDGVEVNVAYGANGKVSTITVNDRVWSYEYAQESSHSLALSAVKLPDQTKWTYQYHHGTTNPTPGQPVWDQCNSAVGNLSTQVSIDENTLPSMVMVHPSGARGEFRFRGVVHGTNNTPGECIVVGTFESGFSLVGLGVPRAYAQTSLVKKTISGPGMAQRIWSYSYFPSWSFAKDCNNGCAETSETRVVDPSGVTRKLTYGNSYSKNAGQLLSEAIEKSGVIHRTTSYSYMLSAAGQAFPESAGNQVGSRNNPFSFKNLPLIATTTAQEAVSYQQTHAAFDQFMRPTSRQSSNSLGWTKTETTEFAGSLAKWVLGNVTRSLTNGIETAFTIYDPATLLPASAYRFGKLQGTATYHSDGNLASSTDGRGQTTTYSSWKRGIPQTIAHPDGTTQSAVVNANGWIASIVDEAGNKTCYTHDAMGRTSSVTYPSQSQPGVCDTSTWQAGFASFAPVATSGSFPPGVAQGQWVQSVWQGNYRKFTYYDAMWRPVLVHEYDATDLNATLRSTSMTYDEDGRINFQSYPSNTSTPAAVGTRTFYDPLGRVVRVEQDSEHGVLATTTEYLPGLQTRVTNPKGQQTVTGYLAWDGPTYDYPIASVQPEGKVVEIARHPQFGWPLQLKQRNAANTISVTRQYVYDAHAQLCKTIEPETGATVTAYDEVGSPAWSATGLVGGGYASATDCSYSAASASGRVVNRVYDNRNRLQHLYFPDGRGNQIWTYTPDSLPASITTYNNSANAAPVVNAYAYNARRMLAGESVSQPDWYTWSIGYGYDGLGNLATQTYPTGLIVDYAPNALGQATKAGNFASGAQYYPNGALKQFTYGNGLIYTMEQNARQLPLRTRSGTQAAGYEYWYDFNGNTTHIHDLVRGSSYSRLLQYDGLDRLTDAGSASFGGNHWHHLRYDALDNITSWTGVKDYAEYGYDAQNRLTNIRNSAGATVVGLSYDEQGNLSNKNGRLHSFDYGNRLREVMGLEYYRYDGHGRRVMTGRPTDFTLYQYSHTGQMLFEQPSASANKTHVYLAGSLVATHSSDGATVYSHTDALGSPVAVTNQAGQVIERHDYEPYGAIIGKPSHSGIGYTGHVMDGGTGLTYMQQRYYDQSVGRFLSVDPVTARADQPDNFNRYWYAASNPYKFTDPDGREIRYGSFPNGNGGNTNQATPQQIESYINFRAAGEYKFDQNRVLQRVGDGIEGAPRSSIYDQKLQSAINAPTVIHVVEQPTVGPVNVSQHGEGVTTRLPSGDLIVAVSGNPLNTVDVNGNPIVENPADIMMHEFLGHGIPQAVNPPGVNGNAIINDNAARAEIGLPLAPPDPMHRER